jgi:hypothetical protein
MSNEDIIVRLEMLYEKELQKNHAGYYIALKNAISLIKELDKKTKVLNEFKEWIKEDINRRNGLKAIEFRDGCRIENISPTYIKMQDVSITEKDILNKLEELEKGDK